MPRRQPLVLLLTHSGDYYTVDRVKEALEARGAEALRVNTDLFPTALGLSSSLGDQAPPSSFVLDRREIPVSAVSAVWLRKIFAAVLPADLDPAHAATCRQESHAALLGWFDQLHHARWVNPPLADEAAENKLRQLREARACGLIIPRTVVTNRAEDARALFRETGGRMVAKLLTPVSVSMEGGGPFVYTSRVTLEDLAEAESLSYCPMVFQELIESALELRVAVVGDRWFVGAIRPFEGEDGQQDWRAGGGRLEDVWLPATLPEEVGRRLCHLLQRLGLGFGACDLIRTPRGEHVFLEVNPAGEWGMLEKVLQLPVSEALAETLLSGGDAG